MTLKKLIYQTLLNNPETRDSDKKLIWEVWKQKGLISTQYNDYGVRVETITGNHYWQAPSSESVRRCRQALQRSDRLLGKWLIQPTKEVEKHRDELASLKGYNFVEGQSTFI